MMQLPIDMPRRYRFAMEARFRHRSWEYLYTLVAAKGGLHLCVAGPHEIDGRTEWSAGLEAHNRYPKPGDGAPSHNKCWLIDGPCWHDGTSLHAREYYLPMFLRGDHAAIFRALTKRADEEWPEADGLGEHGA